ncbi:bifunctional diaminohydroxyphosphoribosylaminopyrimidine deaminase/5-amino-6-(5-phosphoribosylamino)uracil reductase RibD [Chitinimonas lacunae]|uniref:Riboflavin biosynthesis protein RibD n=1 Tax=Chitinimonas lacunae TaxID=1963018 RepID=A0ABV8MKA4_9NEIS
MDFSAQDHLFMAQALRKAQGGRYLSTPNPFVGCVLVRDGVLIGEGHTQVAGGDHAEIQALHDCRRRGNDPRGATAYVTLEPCAHYGRTPPCALRLVEAGVVRVVAAISDPFPEVAGRGLALLREAGITAEVGLMAGEARALHHGFLSRVERGRPWVVAKIGASLDGRTALASGESKWITGEAARADVQHLRARACAIITGVQTVLADDPLLTVRRLDGEPWTLVRQPLRVVLDSRLRTPPTVQMLKAPGKTLFVWSGENTDELNARQAALEAEGAETLWLGGADGRVDLPGLLNKLAERGINTALVEAGGRLNGAFLMAGLVDELVLYQAPVLLGGSARSLAEFHLERLADRPHALETERVAVGEDLRWTLRYTPY